ncbi:FecR protein [Sedimentisphaera cyanobacteriorum]|uniref:FecR protein n=1 Tax=Sedimentisphaera cyanobacteriorum TaxID=1940790 RepID=A0A1Q2HQF1_9BACT|nr:hypothetical protein [Sedimentisphaera cyanobacteriorum]AQQ09514.1 FecR protein [Sedimentisphaera cyanobacteriorum]
MFNSKNEKKQFGLKVLKLLEGTASREEFDSVQELLRKSPEARALYKKYINVYGTLKEVNISSVPNIDDELAKKIIEAEKRAPAIRKCRHEKKQPCLIEDVHYDIPKRHYSKSSVAAFAVSVAAMIAIALILTFAQRTDQSIKAGYVEDSLNAEFSDSSAALSSGDIIWANKKVELSEGFLELKTPSDVHITIEAPAEFELTKQSDIQLNFGSIYANVGEQGIGFTVHSDNMRLIDLGTEFGIYKDKKGWTEAHMIKGKAAFISGNSWLKKTKKELTKGKALGISGGNSDAVEINSETDKFARSIESQFKAVWRGQKTLDLADMVGGGNGLGTGKYKSGLMTIKGKYSDNIKDFELVFHEYSDYQTVDSLPLIDGVFMPDGGKGPVKVSSKGHKSNGLPDTNVKYRTGVINGAFHPRVGPVLPHVMTLKGVRQTYPQTSAIYLHPEQGVTFDLKKIREIAPYSRISRFTARFGLSDSIFNDQIFEKPEKWADKSSFSSIVCDMQVIVDGKLRFEVNNQTPVDKPVDFDIKLNPNDRFLTICSFVPVGKGKGNAGLAMPLFVNPKLHFEPIE